jgi:hypothetical protein
VKLQFNSLFHCPSQILNSIISLSHPNSNSIIQWFHCPSQMLNSLFPAKLTLWLVTHCHMFEHVAWLSYMVQGFKFHCHSQILYSMISLTQPNFKFNKNFLISLPLPNSQFTNFTVPTKVFHSIISLSHPNSNSIIQWFHCPSRILNSLSQPH